MANRLLHRPHYQSKITNPTLPIQHCKTGATSISETKNGREAHLEKLRDFSKESLWKQSKSGADTEIHVG
jgi:hypothetical protein